MKRIWSPAVASLVLLGTLLLADSHACSLCPGGASYQRNTLGMEYEHASLVLFGQVSNPRLNTQPGAPAGSGKTDVLIEKTLKDSARVAPGKTMVVERYMPVLDAKNPPRMLFFGEMVKDKLDIYHGRAASPALIKYLQTTLPFRSKDRVQALVQYANYVNHADPAVADDAFHEFARSKDEDVGRAGKALAPSLVRNLLRDAKNDPDRLSLCAFLLGGCGGEQDARQLRALLDPPNPQIARAIDGILGGYIQLAPKEGWNLAYKLLADKKQQFAVRFAVVRTLRFYHGWQPKETSAQVLHGLSLLVPDGEMADLAIEDLRQWQSWDLTKLILEQHGKPSHAAPIVNRSIIRYALCCPSPEAREFVQRIRRADPETVSDLEEYLLFERKK